MKVLVVGHWQLPPSAPFAPTDLGERALQGLLEQDRANPSSVALEKIAAALLATASNLGTPLEVSVQPFGPGDAFTAAVQGAQGPPGLLEAGHTKSHDWGMDYLARLSGFEDLSLDADPDYLRRALEQARIRGPEITLAASTNRPLLGPGGTAFLTPTLDQREAEDPAVVQRWRALLQESSQLAGNSAFSDPTVEVGSGAAGGSAALILALGGELVDAWSTLDSLVALSQQIANADLVVVVEPFLDAPQLAESPLLFAAQCAQESGTPVVAVCAQSSLSSPERADAGLHGVTVLRRSAADDFFFDVGRRLGQTWLRR